MADPRTRILNALADIVEILSPLAVLAAFVLIVEWVL